MTAKDRDRVQCKGRNRLGKRCGNSAARGQLVCRLHGGASPQAIAKAAQRIAEAEVQEEIQRAVERLEIVPIDDPLTALQTLAGEVWAWKKAIADRVFELDTLRYSTDYGDQLRAEVAVFERALDRCITVLATIAKLRIDERLAAIREDQLRRLTEALLESMAVAGLTLDDADQKEAVVRAFASRLTLAG